jgi:hypothetical protein
MYRSCLGFHAYQAVISCLGGGLLDPSLQDLSNGEFEPFRNFSFISKNNTNSISAHIHQETIQMLMLQCSTVP